VKKLSIAGEFSSLLVPRRRTRWPVLLVGLTLCSEVSALEDAFFSIPRASADVALKAYVQQAQRQVLFPYDVVSRYQANAIEGRMDPDEALEALLQGSGLEAFVDDNRNLVVRVARENEEAEPMSADTNRPRGMLAMLAALFARDGMAQDEERSATIEEVVVTARRVEENLQDVPVSVSAFTADTLERRQITATDDLGKITPNLQFTNNAPLAGNNNSSIIFIRGIGQVEPRANVDPGVGLYIDDVYMGQSVGGTIELRDIESIQVLRGPQGTLFGRNTIGGAVLLTTTEPGDEAGGTVRAGIGDDSLIEVFAAADFPVSDTVRTRFAIGTKQQDGYVTRVADGTDLGDTDNTTFTAKAVFEPGDKFTAKLNFDYTEADENGSALVFADYNNNTNFTQTGPAAEAGWMGASQSVGAGCPDAWIALPGPPGRPVSTAPGSPLDVSGLLTVGGGARGYTAENNDTRCLNNQWAAGPFANNGTGRVDSSLENEGISLNLAYDVNDSVTLKSITSYRELAWTGARDADNTPFLILHTDYDSDGDQLSQEFQFSYQGDRLTAVAGLYYYEEKITDILTVSIADRGPGLSCGPGTDRCHLDSDNNITDNESTALFGQVTYDFTERLSGTLGVRRTEETKASIPDQFDYLNVSAKYLPVQRYEQDFAATTPSASLSYDVTDSTMLYVSYAEGFKGGGWNSTFNFPLLPSDLAAGHAFDQEEVETVELGFKSDVTDTLRLNGAIFSSDYTDLQFTYRVFLAPWFFNAGKASIDGGELELTWLPSERWIVEGGVGYLDSSIDETTPIVVPGRAVNTSVAAGNQLPFAPKTKWNLGVGYDGGRGSVVVSPRIDISYSDEVFFDAANTVQIAQTDDYTVLDVSVAIENTASDWRFIFGLNNATDEEYRVSGNSSLGSGSGYAEVAYARPRMWFANFVKDF
jgi:iron complex outermembrane receptor protein